MVCLFLRHTKDQGGYMRNKIIIVMLMLASAFVILPAANFAAANESTNSVVSTNYSPQIRVQIRRQQRRHRNLNPYWQRRHDNGRHIGWYNNRTRMVQQAYWVNGRRYVRWVRVRY
jgi:hypothetical protein